MLQKKLNPSTQQSISTKYIVDDENSFQFFSKNNFEEITLVTFDERQIEKKLPFYLKSLEELSKYKNLKIDIAADSPLILIAITLLKKIAGLNSIELTARRGHRPEEIIKTAKTLRSHGLPVRVRYIRK